MNQVYPDEDALLRLAMAVVGLLPPWRVAKLVLEAQGVPQGLGPDANMLLRRILSVGVTRGVVRSGGWLNAAHLRAGVPVPGRLWHRGELPDPVFGPGTHQLLMWLLGPRAAALRLDPPASWAERWLVCGAVEVLLASKSKVADPLLHEPMVWLRHGAHLAVDHQVPNDLSGPDLFLLEACQQELSRSWMAWEDLKLASDSPEQHAAAQSALLTALISHLEQAQRPDLLAFLNPVASQALRRPPSAWKIDRKTQPLRARQLTRHAAVTVPRLLGDLERWKRQLVQIRVFDDEYPRSQHLLRCLEPILAQTQALRSVAAEALDL